MIGDMKIDESSLTRYLVKNLEPLTEADPVILADYVAALLKKEKPTEELQKLCTDNLVEFLGHETNSFVKKLFHVLEDGSIVTSVESLDTIKQVEPSPALNKVGSVELKSPSPNPERFSISSGHASDSEEKEVTDDDDDDRNHKHRRRDTRSHSFDKDAQERFPRRQDRQRSKPFENGHLFMDSDSQSSEMRCTERDLSTKFEKQHHGLAPPFLRPPMDLGIQPRMCLPFRNDATPRFDFSTTLTRLPNGPIVRGRGRGTGSWNQHDSRFSSVENIDFVSPMAPQGPTTPSLFAGRGLPSIASTQSASWGAFGLIHGIPNGGLDTLHPLGLQGLLRPPLNPPMNIGMPRQRCRDFEERGFCLRGDVCPMEHGVNRIVVEDVQSLSQFNLPVSIPSACLLGMQAGTGPLPTVTVPSTLLLNDKGLHNKNSKYGSSNVGLSMNGEADLYDPDQPLWNNGRSETSSALVRLPSPKVEDTEANWDADPSEHHSFMVSGSIDSEMPGRGSGTTIGSQCTTSSVWGRIGNSGNKLELTSKIENTLADTDFHGNQMKENQEVKLTEVHVNTNQGKQIIAEGFEPKAVNLTTTPRWRGSTRNFVRGTEKAFRTLYVNGIPLKNNKRDALLSHFQKFGEVIDIHIPLNSEKAFVQFSRREDAEAALKAPDAVMGNRFIKLYWANRDSIPNDGESSGNAVKTDSQGVLVPSQQPVADREKENAPSAAPKINTTPASEVPVSGSVPPVTVAANGLKAPPPQKKLETLEVLKEELRKKQEMLAQKRSDFRRQLDKLEKQGIAIKGDASSDHVVKRQKVESVAEVATSTTPRLLKSSPTGFLPEAEKTPEKNTSGENPVSPSLKVHSTITQQSPRSLKQPVRMPAQGGLFPVNRFKLDNRPTAFKILPPLPVNFSDVAVLKEHFSSFNDLCSIELEDPEGYTGSKPCGNCSARITFTTRRSAEKAFLNGKCWQGNTLNFMWLSASSNSSSEHTAGENSVSLTPKGPPDAELVAESLMSSSPSTTTGKSTCSVISLSAPTNGNRESGNAEGINGGQGSMPKDQVEACQSSPTLPSPEKGASEADVDVKDDLNLG